MSLGSPNPSIVPKYDPWLVRPAVSTAPPGLRNLSPVSVPPKPVAKPKPPQEHNLARLAPCGTKAARRRHRRNDETCEVCAQALASSLKVSRIGNREPSRCGSIAGYQKHYRAGEKPCEPCKKAQAAKSRDRRAAKRAEAAA